MPVAEVSRIPSRADHSSNRICRRCVLAIWLTVVPVLLAAEPRSPSPLQFHQWEQQLASKDWILQAEALQGLGKWKVQSAVPSVTQVFKSGASDWVRGRAMVTLGEIQGDQIVEHARQAAKDPSPVLRKAALETFELVGGETSTDVVKNLLEDPDASVQAKAAALFASREPEAAWPIVDRLTADPQVPVNQDHMRALAHVGSEASIQRLASIFDKAEAGSRQRRDLLTALAVADEVAIPLIAYATAHYPPSAREFRLGQDALESRKPDRVAGIFQSMLGDEDTALYANLAPLVATVQPTPQMGDLLAASWMLRDGLPAPAARSGMKALSQIEPGRYESFFTHYLKDEDPQTRALAVRCRSLCSVADLFEIFRQHVRDKEPQVIQAALESLQRVPVDARPAEGLLAYLSESLKSEDATVLHAAMELLGRRGQPQEFEASQVALTPHLAGGSASTRTVAATALSALGQGGRNAEVAAAQGYVAGWRIVGPFLNDRENKEFATVYPPEESLDQDGYKAEYRWDFGGGQSKNKELELTWADAYFEDHTGDIHVAVQMPVPVKYAIAYAKADVIAEEERIVRAILTQDRRMTQRLWLNGEKVVDLLSETHEPRTYAYKLKLRQGVNKFFLKTATFEGPWVLKLRLLDEKESHAATGLRQVLPKPSREEAE